MRDVGINSSKAILTYGGTNIPSGSDLNTYTTPGTYFSNLPTAPLNVPTGFGGYFKLVVGTTTGVTSGTIRARVQTISKSGTSGVEEYTRVLRSEDSGSTWNIWKDWEKLPTRSEIDAHMAKITTINNTNSPYTKTFSADEYCVIFVTLNNDFNVYYAFSTNGSNCVLMKIHENISSISASVSGNTLSITNTASSNARLVFKRL